MCRPTSIPTQKDANSWCQHVSTRARPLWVKKNQSITDSKDKEKNGHKWQISALLWQQLSLFLQNQPVSTSMPLRAQIEHKSLRAAPSSPGCSIRSDVLLLAQQSARHTCIMRYPFLVKQRRWFYLSNADPFAEHCLALSHMLQKQLCFSNLFNRFLESSYTSLIYTTRFPGAKLSLNISKNSVKKNPAQIHCLICMACSMQTVLNLTSLIFFIQYFIIRCYSLAAVAKSVLYSIPSFCPSLKEKTEWSLML